MPLASMTGFARTDGGDEGLTWAWEVKSVNGKGLDIRTRIPTGFDGLEQAVRGLVGKYCNRGSLSISLAVETPTRTPEVRINRPLLDRLIAELDAVRSDHNLVPTADTPRLEELLSIRGVIETVDGDDTVDPAARQAAMLTDFERAMGALSAARAEEGMRLHAVLDGHLARVSALIGEMAELAALQPDALKSRLREQVAALLEASSALSEDRLAQECAILIAKGDVREELDRLAAHIAAARDLMAESQPVGRRFDFLCQEFNREANTLCSKSSDTEQTRIGLALKAVIDQIREQAANIE